MPKAAFAFVLAASAITSAAHAGGIERDAEVDVAALAPGGAPGVVAGQNISIPGVDAAAAAGVGSALLLLLLAAAGNGSSSSSSTTK